MSFEADFRTFLLGSGALAAAVGPRVVWGELPDGDARPIVCLWTTTSYPDVTMDGPNGLDSRRIQIDCWGMTLEQAKALDEAIRIRVAGFRGTVGGTDFKGIFIVNRSEERSPAIGAPAQRYFGARLDVVVWFSPG